MLPKIELMLSIFSKKYHLADYIDGLTDFHNHILPGIDDGAKTVQESMQLINEFKNIGIDHLVATPHVIGEYYPNTPATISKAFEDVNSNLEEDTKLGYAAEYMMDQYFLDVLKNGELLKINGNKVLVEMSYFQPPLNLNEILFKLQNQSYAPILAHPERYVYLHEKSLEKFKDLKSRGCEFQLNMLSLSGHYGQGIQKTAIQLLENNMIDYIASDVHRIDHIHKIKQIKLTKKRLPFIEKVIKNNRQLFKN